LKNILYTI